MYEFSVPGVDAPVNAPVRSSAQASNRVDPRDRRTSATFFIEAVENPTASAEQGRPIYRDVEMARILIHGDAKTEVVRKVTEPVRNEYRFEYDHWKRTQQQAVVGTPLEQWPGAGQSFIKACKHINVFSVEQFAGLPDNALREVGPDARTYQARAKAWLAAAQDGAETERLAAENARLQDQITALQGQLKEIGTKFDQMQAAEGPRKGR